MYRSEKWWGKHDHEYVHYFYKIVNTSNSKYYYGIHSIKKTHKKINDLEHDGYWGSGKELDEDKKAYGLKSFTKTIEKTFSTRKEVLDYESKVITHEMLLDPLCYNMVCGGGGNPYSLGMVVVIVKDTGKFLLIDKEEYETNKNKYTTSMSGKVSAITNDGRSVIVSVEEYHENKDKYKTKTSGVGFYKDSTDWSKTAWLRTDDERVISGKFIPNMTGIKLSNELREKRTGEGNGMFGKVWITDGVNNTAINENERIPDGWKKGRTLSIQSPASGKQMYINRITKDIKFYGDDETIEQEYLPSFLFDKEKNLITFERLDKVHQICRDWDFVKQVDPLFPCTSTVKQIVDYYYKQGLSLTKLNKRVTRTGQKYSKEKDFYFITDGTNRLLVTNNDYKSSYMDWKVLGLEDITIDEYNYIKSVLKSKKKIRKTLSTSYDKLNEFLKKAGI